MKKEMNREALQANLHMLNKQGEQTLEAVRQQDPAAAEKLVKIEKLLGDEAFTAAFLAVESAEAGAALFAQHGVELSAEDVAALARQIKVMTEKLIQNGGELSEEEMEAIAGGKFSWGIVGIIAGMGSGMWGGMGALFGTIICPGVGTAIGAAVGAVGGALAGGGIGALFSWLDD